jgi:hypothetical protein
MSSIALPEWSSVKPGILEKYLDEKESDAA